MKNNKVTEECVLLSSAMCFLHLFHQLLQTQQKVKENIFRLITDISKTLIHADRDTFSSSFDESDVKPQSHSHTIKMDT
jgi:hypothetical protein